MSEATSRATTSIAPRRKEAEALGRRVAEHIAEPDAFAAALRAGFADLADPEYLAGQQRIAPGIRTIHGVRSPLLQAVARGFRQATRTDRASAFLYAADRLFREEHLEARWFAFDVLRSALPQEPERTWQLLRRAARDAADWITVDSLARVYARGILLEPYRWAELEQLVYAASTWERRLVGSTVATLPVEDRAGGREADVARRGLTLVAELIGDAEPDVQKALSWALRSLVLVDLEAVTLFCDRESRVAAENDDGHRAWVIRDALPKVDPQAADAIRARVAGIRRRAGAPSTSRAAATAARFAGLNLGARLAEPPLT